MVATLGRLKFELVLPTPEPISWNDQCHESSENETNPQYEINDLTSIWYRVVCVNRVPSRKFPKSLLGPTGHLERANVWTHLFAAAIYLIHAITRSRIYSGGEKDSLSTRLVTVDSIALVFTFLISATYHVYSANKFWSAITRLGDYFGIYLGIATGYLADLSVATLNLKNVSATSQANLDLWFAMAFMVVFFCIRRSLLSVDETRHLYFKNKCSLGLARSTNVDLEHSSLRVTGGFIMAFSWILTMPLGVKNLEADCSAVFVWSHIIGTLILVGGMLLDNVFMYPDDWFMTSAPPRRCVCYSSREGCGGGWICNSHALWHVIALMSTVSTTAGLEYVVSNSERLYT